MAVIGNRRAPVPSRSDDTTTDAVERVASDLVATVAANPSEAPARDGEIPFRIRIGVTGHRNLEHDPSLDKIVRRQVVRIRDELFPTGTTEVRLAVVSQLAEGADRLLVRHVFAEARDRGETAHLEVVLPVDRGRYPELQGFSAASRREFERLVESATSVTEIVTEDLSTADDRGAAYTSASRQLIARADVIIALWDGGRTGGGGGTAETLLDAAARSKPCIWISSDGEPTVHDNLEVGSGRRFYEEVEKRAAAQTSARKPGAHPENVLEPMREAFRPLDEYNRERLPRDFEQRLGQELGSETGLADWVAAPFTRATLLARRWQRWFRSLSWLISAFAAAAAVALAISLSYGEGTAAWRWAEAISFSIALAGLAIVRFGLLHRRGGFHSRWLSYRYLAERLRTAHYLAPTGVEFRRQARLQAVYVAERSEGWLMRAYEEVWDRRPTEERREEAPRGAELERLKRHLAEDWIGKQIRYHEAAQRRHLRWRYVLTAATSVLFALTLPFAFIHATQVSEHLATFCTIALPAAGASLGVILTINQHHALSERHAIMQSDLRLMQHDILDANGKTLRHVSSEAARMVAQETDAWFGAMWFLDIEHP